MIEILKKEEIDKLVKHNCMLKIREVELEIKRRMDLDDSYDNEFISFKNDSVCEKFENLGYPLSREFVRFCLDDLINIDLRCDHNHGYHLTFNVSNISSDIEKVYDAYIKVAELCKLIKQGEFEPLLNSIKDKEKEIQSKKIDLKLWQIDQYKKDLKERFENIKFEEAFTAGNTFEFEYGGEYIRYESGKSKRRYYQTNGSVFAKLLYIQRITPTMVEFKVKKEKTDENWFEYTKTLTENLKDEKGKVIRDADGKIEKTKVTKKIDLIKKKKSYIYDFIRNGRMKLIVKDSRKNKLKNILEAERENED
jgi:hypothetical protein